MLPFSLKIDALKYTKLCFGRTRAAESEKGGERKGTPLIRIIQLEIPGRPEVVEKKTEKTMFGLLLVYAIFSYVSPKFENVFENCRCVTLGNDL